MNNLVHIPMTPAAQRERKKGMKRGRERERDGQVEKEIDGWTEEGKIKAEGGKRGMSREDKRRKRGEKREEWQMIADVCQGIT